MCQSGLSSDEIFPFKIQVGASAEEGGEDADEAEDELNDDADEDERALIRYRQLEEDEPEQVHTTCSVLNTIPTSILLSSSAAGITLTGGITVFNRWTD